MLSQRLALYYFANVSNIRTDEVDANLKEAFSNFDDAISDLLLSNFNNENVEKVLGEAMRDWDEFKNHKEEFLTHRLSSNEVYARTNNLTKTFNKLTALYERVKLN